MKPIPLIVFLIIASLLGPMIQRVNEAALRHQENSVDGTIAPSPSSALRLVTDVGGTDLWPAQGARSNSQSAGIAESEDT